MKIQQLGLGDLDRLRPLWLMLHAHHQKVAPSLAPYLPDDTSWINRRQQYVAALAEGGICLVATSGATDLGYLLAAKRAMAWTATFDLPEILWELVTLFVCPDQRGQGIGSKLLDAWDEIVAADDTSTKLVGVIPDNHRAVDHYRSRGFVPAWLTQTRFQRPPRAPPPRTNLMIERLAERDVDQLEDLWLALHHHHQDVSPHLGPFVDDAKSWPIIRDLMAKSARDDLLWVVREEQRPVGLASVAIEESSNMLSYSDTWATGPKISETKFLVIDQRLRGKGIGGALMDAVDAELTRRGASDHLIGAIEPNAGAINFYRSRGFRAAWLELVKW